MLKYIFNLRMTTKNKLYKLLFIKVSSRFAKPVPDT